MLEEKSLLCIGKYYFIETAQGTWSAKYGMRQSCILLCTAKRIWNHWGRDNKSNKENVHILKMPNFSWWFVCQQQNFPPGQFTKNKLVWGSLPRLWSWSRWGLRWRSLLLAESHIQVLRLTRAAGPGLDGSWVCLGVSTGPCVSGSIHVSSFSWLLSTSPQGFPAWPLVTHQSAREPFMPSSSSN